MEAMDSWVSIAVELAIERTRILRAIFAFLKWVFFRASAFGLITTSIA